MDPLGDWEPDSMKWVTRAGVHIDRASSAWLIARFIEEDAVEGLVGRDAGPRVKQLPSSMYWTALDAWGVLRWPGTIDQTLHRAGAVQGCQVRRHPMEKLNRSVPQVHDADPMRRARDAHTVEDRLMVRGSVRGLSHFLSRS